MKRITAAQAREKGMHYHPSTNPMFIITKFQSKRL